MPRATSSKRHGCNNHPEVKMTGYVLFLSVWYAMLKISLIITRAPAFAGPLISKFATVLIFWLILTPGT